MASSEEQGAARPRTGIWVWIHKEMGQFAQMGSSSSQSEDSDTGTPIAWLFGRMNWWSRICALNLSAGAAGVRVPDCPTRERLAQAFSRLQNIQLVRNHRQDPWFGKSAEERILWRELLDLELQDVDEQIDRILESSGDGSA
jgi:hypothetical protein